MTKKPRRGRRGPEPASKRRRPTARGPWRVPLPPRPVLIALAAVVVLVAAFLVLRSRIGPSPLARLDSNSLAPAADLWHPDPDRVRFSGFIGADSCQRCHEREYDMWKNSTHFKAGGPPTRDRVIAHFNGRPIHFKDAVVTPTATPEGQYRFAVRQTGQPERTFDVAEVVGGGHMFGGGTQSFFGRFPDGTLRFLPFDFIRKEDTWFVQLRASGHWVPVSDTISLADLMQWPPQRALGTNPNISNCQNCHGSQILLDGDPADGFTTRFATLQVDCEACHGPSARHVELARRPDFAKLKDIGVDALQLYDKNGSIDVCLKCHAIKDALREDFLPGDPLEDYYTLKMPILASEPYLPDGRVRQFAYQQGHVFSDCYRDGSMTCVDCHDPHTQKYRDIYGNPLDGRFDNGQCTDCHFAKARHPERHSRHKPDSTGTVCTGCHMPYLQHRGIGHALVFSRSDHVIPIPRPVHDAAEGIEDACTKCHRKWSVDTLQVMTDRWWGKLKPINLMTRDIEEAESVRDPGAAGRLLLHPQEPNPIGEVYGVARYVKNYLTPDMPRLPAGVRDSLERLALNPDLDVRAIALMGLHFAAGNDARTRAWLAKQLRGLGPDERPVRDRWAMGLDFLGTLYATRSRLSDAVRIHRKALEIKPVDPAIWIDLAQDYRDMRDFRGAITAFEEAIRLQPRNADTRFQLAEMYLAARRRREAADMLRSGLELDPGNLRARMLLRRLQ